MAASGYPLVWDDVNAGYVVAAPTVVTGTLISSSATIQLSTNVTCVEGALVTSAGAVLPRFTNAAFSNSGSIVLNGTIGNSVTQAVTIWNYPNAISNEMTATLASGAALASGSTGWRGTGIILPQDTTPTNAANTTNYPAPLADVYFFPGGAVTPAVSGAISGWFLKSFDGTNFETAVSTPSTTVAALSRAPDFIVSLDNAAFASGNFRLASGDIELPSTPFKTLIQNNAGVALPINSAIVICPKALAY